MSVLSKKATPAQRKWLHGHADAWASELARRELMDKSWLDLLREISRLDHETDWEGADDDTFLEEFDPWVIVRALAASEEET